MWKAKKPKDVVVEKVIVKETRLGPPQCECGPGCVKSEFRIRLTFGDRHVVGVKRCFARDRAALIYGWLMGLGLYPAGPEPDPLAPVQPLGPGLTR